MALAPKDRVAWVRAIVALVTLVALVAMAMASLEPPSPVPETALLTEFSSARAMKHLAVISAKPHRMGSPEHEAVRAYVVRELEALGLAVEVQEAPVVQLRFAEKWGLPVRAATVKNVVARLRGTEGGRAVLLMAHYDTRSMTPGAGDDGAGVAALLETARALATGTHPRRDVVFLVTDGEEMGLLGAKAFLEGHPAAHDAAIVLNFDARGDRGPALMFQTSENASALVRELGAVVPHALASSLSQAIYKRMPNDSDLSEFLPTGVDAMNVGYVDGVDRYHSPSDTIANMDEGTLQHIGAYMLPLARRFGNLPLPIARDGESTYFNVGATLVRYPARADVAIAVVVDVLLVAVIVFAVKRRRARIGGVFASVGVALTAMLVSALAAHGLWTLGVGKHADYTIVAAASSALKDRWGVTFVLIAIASVASLHAILASRLRAIELGLGAAIVFGVLAIPAAVALPGGGWIVAWPLAGAIVPWAIAIRAAETDEESFIAFVVRLVACALPVALLVPVVALFYATFGPDGAFVVTPIIALGASLLAPAIGDVLAPNRRALPALALVGALAFAIASWTTAPFDRATPRPDTLFFAVDADAHRSWWASPDSAPDAWTSKVLGKAVRGGLPSAFSAYGTEGLLSAEVPFVDVEAARIEVTRDDRAASKTIDLRVVPPPLAEVVVVRIPNDVVAARVEGRAIPVKNGIVFYYSAPPAAGFTLSIDVASTAPLKIKLLAQRPGFPATLVDALGPRPEGLAPKPGMLPPWDEMQESDMTTVARVIDL